MPSDLRDELVERIAEAYSPAPKRHIEAVLDSVPPGSFKLDEKTWVKLEAIGRGHFRRGRFELHTEDVELTCDPCPAVYTEVDHAE